MKNKNVGSAIYCELCTLVYLFLIVFTYVLGHHVQFFFGSTDDYHVHSFLSQLREVMMIKVEYFILHDELDCE